MDAPRNADRTALPRGEASKLRAWRAFIEAHAAVVRRLEQELLVSHRLPLSYFDVLVQLYEADRDRADGEGGLRVQELADRVLLTRSGVSRLVDRMQLLGLVDRRPCPTDKRGTVVVLTPSGRQALAAASPDHLAGIRAHFTRHLTDEEATTLEAAFTRMLAAEVESRT